MTMTKRLDRQQFLGRNSDLILLLGRVAIVGLGGGGSHLVQQLAHLGVGRLLVYDADRVEDSNLNRLVGATEQDIARGTLKTEVAKRVVSQVNSKATVRTFSCRWQEAHEPLRTCNVVFGCVDRFDERRQLEAYCRRFLIPFIDIGMDVHKLGDRYAIAGQIILSMPGEPCMECIGFFREDEDGPRYGDAGSKPQVVWPNGILASFAVGVFVQLMTPWHPGHERVIYLEYDGNSNRVKPSAVLGFLPKACPHFPPDAVGDPFLK
jgi:hypothetical protein